MDHSAPRFLIDILVILLAAIIGVSLSERARLGPVVGYLLAGLIVGPAVLNLIPDVAAPQAIAELGVVFLLFTVGLELPMERLRLMPAGLFVLGVGQVVVTTAMLAVAGILLGLNTAAAIAVGGILSLSSTAIVLRLLSDRREIGSRFGRGVIGVLVIQDLAVAPLIVLIPALRGTWAEMAVGIGVSLGKATLVTILILGIGRYALRPVMRLVAATRISEVFAAMTLLLVLAASALTHIAGLSMAFGALLAGMLLADTAYRHQVEAEISHFRGLLLGLFFMTVGMLLNPTLLTTYWFTILPMVIGLLTIKALILYLMARRLLLTEGPSIRLGLLLAQSGEFAFVLLALAQDVDVIAPDLRQYLTVAVILSMMATPFLNVIGQNLSPRVARRTEINDDALPSLPGGTTAHVILAGYGRIGAAVSRHLTRQGIPWVALDTDPNLINRARREGHSVYYGDADRIEVLEALGLADARGVVIAIDNPKKATQLAALVHYILPEMPVLARAYDDRHAEELKQAGAMFAIPEPSPISDMIAGHLLGLVEAKEGDAKGSEPSS